MGSQRVEAVVPELVQVLAKRCEGLRASSVQATRAVPPLVEEPCLAQHAQVLGDRRSRHLAEVAGNRAGGQLSCMHETQDLATAGIGDGLDRALHDAERNELLT